MRADAIIMKEHPIPPYAKVIIKSLQACEREIVELVPVIRNSVDYADEWTQAEMEGELAKLAEECASVIQRMQAFVRKYGGRREH